MKRMTIGLLLCMASLSACSNKVPPLTEQEKTVVSELTMNMQPRCVGRYLIDLPANLEVRGYAKFNDVLVEAEAKPLRVFELEMRQREDELSSTKHLEGYKFLLDYGMVKKIEHSQYFVSLSDRAGGDVKRVIEAYKWDRGYKIEMRIDASDSINAEYTKKYKGTPYGISEPINDVPEKLRLAFDLIERLQGRGEDVIPSEPGTCFKGGFLQGHAVSEDEEISSSFAFQGAPDVTFRWESFGNLQADDTLIPRIKSRNVQEQLKAANGQVLRLDSFVSKEGIKADEALLAGLTTSSPPVHGHLFSLEANYQGTAHAPYLIWDMRNGYGDSPAENDASPKSLLSDAEAVALWDAVSRTLRPRPNAF